MAVAMRQALALLALCALAACHVTHAYEEDYDDVSVEDLDVYSQARALSEGGAEPEAHTELKPRESEHHHPRPHHRGKHHPRPQHRGHGRTRKPHRSGRKQNHRGRVLQRDDNGGGVIVTQEVRDQWPGPNGKTFKRWEVVVVNTGHRAVTVKEIKCENFRPAQKWNIDPSGDVCKIPSWGQKIEPNKFFNFGYIGDKQGDFSYGRGGDVGRNNERGRDNEGGRNNED